MNVKKSPGWDGLPPVFLKSCARALAPAVAVLYNRSIRECKFPEIWKKSVITPVPKKGDLSIPSNWRPINVLGAVPKMLERHVRELLEPYILPKLSGNQFGFIRGRSTEDALMYADHTIRHMMSSPTARSRKGTVLATSFDISKAFDSVPHAKLLECLKADYNVPDYLLSWLQSYLSERSQAVKIESSFSSCRQVKAGVIQGSVIGPLLFIAYFDKVVKDHTNSAVSVKYADDLLLLHPVNDVNDEQILQQTIDDICGEMEAKSLSFNAQKCFYEAITESSVPYIPTNPPSIRGAPITPSDGLTYLGVTMDPKLTWSSNTTQKVCKAKRAVGCIHRLLKRKIPIRYLRHFILAKILPIFTYGITVTYPRNKSDRVSLERMNRYVAQITTNDYVSSYVDLLRNASMQPIFQRVLHQRLGLAQQYSKGRRYLPLGTLEAYERNDRRPHRLHHYSMVVPNPTSRKYAKSALEILLQSWNRVPERLLKNNVSKLRRRLEDDSYEDTLWEIYAAMYATILQM